jgi:hypothetical protein
MLGHSDHRVCKTGLLDVAWLLPTMGHTAEGTDVVRLGYAYAHDAALLEAILHAERRVGDSQKRLEYAWRGNYNRFHELHALCTVDPPTVAAAIVGGYVDVARALLAKGAGTAYSIGAQRSSTRKEARAPQLVLLHSCASSVRTLIPIP